MKKKYVEAPEIEKEVKRLLRVDNDAVNVKWEVICEDEDQSKPSKVSSSGTVKTKRESINGNTSQSLDVGEKCSSLLFLGAEITRECLVLDDLYLFSRTRHIW